MREWNSCQPGTVRLATALLIKSSERKSYMYVETISWQNCNIIMYLRDVEWVHGLFLFPLVLGKI